MTASVSRLHAGDGYTYLTRQVASGDHERERGQDLADYYTAQGAPPGHWHGRGLEALGMSGVVTEAHMKALFGDGLHPDADRLVTERTEGGMKPEEAIRSVQLGRRCPAFDPSREETWQAALEAEQRRVRFRDQVPVGESLTREQRREARLSAGRELFETERGRVPGSVAELEAWTTKRARPTPQPVSGYDVTFTPAKSVSVLWGLGDDDTRRAVEAAHAEAVDTALDYIEREVLFTRTGAAGVAQHDASGLVAARFDHYDSRTGDPNLHSHVAIANRVQGPDGKWRSVDGRTIFQANVAYSETYNTALEDGLRERLGVEFIDRETGAGKRPIREVAGVDTRLTEAFATRRSAIEQVYGDLVSQYRADHGHDPSRAVRLELAQRATLETRTEKGPMESLATKRERWHSIAVTVAGPGVVEDLTRSVRDRADAARAETPEREPTPVVAGVQQARVVDEAGRFVGVEQAAEVVIARVAQDRATWRETHLRAETHRQVRTVPGLDAEARSQLVEDVCAAARAASVLCEAPEVAEVPDELQRANGELVFRAHGSQRYTSRAILDAEADLVDAARTPVPGVLEVAGVEAVIEQAAADARAGDGHALDAGQAALVREFGCADRQLVVAIGPAGAGKTRALRALVDAAQAQGHQVLGLAPSAAAAKVLAAETGAARADTMAKVLHTAALEGASATGIDAGDLVVVDEAGMASTHDLAALHRLCDERGAVLRLIGDDQQLSAVAAGGALRTIAHEVGAVQLTDLHRFTDPEEAAATLRLREGDHAAIGFYEDADRLAGGTREAMVDQLYADWTTDQQHGRTSVMIVGDNATVTELSERARTDRIAAGLVEADGLTLRSGSTAGVGDVVVTRRNDRTLKTGSTDFVKNGDLWTVTGRDTSGALTVKHASHGGSVTLPADYVAGQVELGYATTVHRAQGMTVDTSRTLVDERTGREQLYVAMTRGREENRAYAVTDTYDALHADHQPERTLTAREILTQALDRRDDGGQSAHQTIATAYEEARSLERLVPEYEHALGLAHAQRVDTAVTRVLDEYQVPGRDQLRDDPAYAALRSRLAQRAEAGHDPGQVLASVVDRRELGTAESVSAALVWRLDQQAAGRASEGREQVTVRYGDTGLGRWLAARREQIQARETELEQRVRTEKPAWARDLEDRDLSSDPRLLGDVAVFRDRHGVRDEQQALGNEPESRTRAHDRWTELQRRTAAAPERGDNRETPGTGDRERSAETREPVTQEPARVLTRAQRLRQRAEERGEQSARRGDRTEGRGDAERRREREEAERQRRERGGRER